MGDQAQLAGTDREVVEFDLMLSSAELTNLSALNLALYDLNAHTGLPDKQLWTTSIANVSVDGLTEVTFSVPHISVLTDFVWVASADSNIAGLATFDPPTVGSSPTFGPDHIDYYWDLDSSSRQWIGCTFEGSLVANFGAKIVAVPEPATLGLISFGCLLMSRKKRSAR
jgi:hypothetical protein